MSDSPGDLRFTKEHAWMRSLAGQEVEFGITEQGQEALGDLVSVELPAIGHQVKAGDAFVTLESTKTAFELSCPVAGEVTAVNTDLKDAPERINEDPYGKGWLVRLHLAVSPDSSVLLDPAAYETFVKSEGA